MYKVTRRNVLATLSGSAVFLCPAVLNAQDWGDIPTTTPVGQKELIEAEAGPISIDISALMPGEVTVIGRPSTSADHSRTEQIHYVGVLKRTPEQIAYAEAQGRAGNAQDPNYLVVDLTCPHRGKAVGITGNPETPFACTDRGGRHSSDFDASGWGTAGASKDEGLKIPDHTIETMDGKTILALA